MADDLTSGANAFVASLDNSVKTQVPAGEITAAQSTASAQDEANYAATKDWRVRLRLAPGSTYLYNAPNPGILAPLAAKESGSDGVIFPYTPTISVNYSANYEGTSPTHSNYKIFQYNNSSVENVVITGEFTCQDSREAQYLLAVIHFFRSMTKMFYGQDTNPRNGTPPPLCYLSGMGGYQFSQMPLGISNFTYNLPNDCDYIKTTISAAPGLFDIISRQISSSSGGLGSLGRLLQLGLKYGGSKREPEFKGSTASNSAEVTWVPTKIQLSITCVPVMSRNQVSNEFSLRDYASGNLLLGAQRNKGGMW